MKGKVTVITGGAQGIGREIAMHFARAGSDICIGDINYDLSKETGKEIEGVGVRCLVIDVDTSDYIQVEQMINKIVKKFNRLDILINNAAFVEKVPFLDYTEESWKRTIDTSLNGYFYCSQLAARKMVETGTKKGKIIHISSITGFIPHAGLMAYSAAKAGVQAMTKSMSHELRKYDISVNAVVPAVTDTPLMKGVIEKMKKGEGQGMPGSAVKTAGEVAQVVLQVASDKDNLLSGNIINVGSSALGS